MNYPIPSDCELIAEAREWLVECFPEQEEGIREAAREVIVANVRKHYDGGWAAFLETAAYNIAACGPIA